MGIIEAIIEATAAVIAALIGRTKTEGSDLFDRGGRAWAGLWQGTADVDARDVRYELSILLTQRGRQVKGTVRTSKPEAGEWRLEGHLREPEYLAYLVINVDSSTVNYGVGVLHCDRAARSISGEYLGRSRFGEGVVHGKIELSRAQ